MASVKEYLNQCYGKLYELWYQLHLGSNSLENLPKLFNEVILLLKSNLFDHQQTRTIGTQDEEELIDDYKFYIAKEMKSILDTLKQHLNHLNKSELNLIKQLRAEFVILEDKLALEQQSSQREKNQLKRSENTNKKSIEGFELKVSAQV